MVYYRDLMKSSIRSDPGKAPAERKENQSDRPRRNVFLPKERSEYAFWMEQLPAHVWIQGEDDTIVFSNRMAATEIIRRDKGLVCANKINCHSALRKNKTSCSCCIKKKVSENMRQEMCVCKRGHETYHVYHFPFFDSWQSPGRTAQVLKIEIKVANGNQPGVSKDQETELTEEGKSPDPQQELVTICSFCKNIRDEIGGWTKLEKFFHDHFMAKFSHGICPECASKHYPSR